MGHRTSPLPFGSIAYSVHGIELSVLAQWAYGRQLGVSTQWHIDSSSGQPDSEFSRPLLEVDGFIEPSWPNYCSVRDNFYGLMRGLLGPTGCFLLPISTR